MCQDQIDRDTQASDKMDEGSFRAHHTSDSLLTPRHREVPVRSGSEREAQSNKCKREKKAELH